MADMKIAIIGGGASGMMAAIVAARQGAEVTIYEKKERIGKKILATGNGKCNFSNVVLSTEDYRGDYLELLPSYLSEFNETDSVPFFSSLGMLIRDKNGYLYPASEQASTVLDLLRQELTLLMVRIITDASPVISTKTDCGSPFYITHEKKKMEYDKVILSCGSYAGEKAQNEQSGYEYAKAFGHHIVPVVPALVQLRSKETYFKSISGVRCDALISLLVNGKKVEQDRGELQLTDYGISGIPVFQISRFASYALLKKESVRVTIDLLPDFSAEDLKIMLTARLLLQGHKTVEEFLTGILNKKLNALFLKFSNLKAEKKANEYTMEQFETLLFLMKSWDVPICATNPFENAQVCAGGIDMKQVDLHLESKLCKGLYFTGELLDIDGKCGGYNLQWAWTSGYIAGKYASTL